MGLNMHRLFCAILLIMSIVLANGSALAAAPFVAKPVTGSEVMKMLWSFKAPETSQRDFIEISEAIATGSTQDPLFPEIEEGSRLTAAILVALAWHESNFRRSVVGDQGRSFGLYQIQPGVHKVEVKLLTVPRSATLIAIDLIRRSVKWCMANTRPWKHALAFYAASSDAGARHPKIVEQSVVRMETAAKVYLVAFGKPQGEPVMERLLVANGGAR
jgi:hypothetical protein